MTDNVNHPTHYLAGGFEALDVLEAFFPDDPLGWQVGKYMLRYKKKNGLEDLRKAEVYLKRLIARMEQVDLDVLQPRGFVDYKPLPEPRVWRSITPVPFDVVVSDRDGDRWKWSGSGLHVKAGTDVEPKWTNWGTVEDDFDSRWGPFTEVLETH